MVECTNVGAPEPIQVCLQTYEHLCMYVHTHSFSVRWHAVLQPKITRTVPYIYWYLDLLERAIDLLYPSAHTTANATAAVVAVVVCRVRTAACDNI